MTDTDDNFCKIAGDRKRPGPPPDPVRAMVRSMMPEWSERTFATYWRALKLIQACKGEESKEFFAKLLRLYTRPNGSINVSGLCQHAEHIYFAWEDER